MSTVMGIHTTPPGGYIEASRLESGRFCLKVGETGAGDVAVIVADQDAGELARWLLRQIEQRDKPAPT
jgi:hypothetical protein